MVAYSFKKRFEQPLRDRTKAGTIRLDRKRHARPGEVLQLYVGMRTRHCRKVATETCTAVHDIHIEVCCDGLSIDVNGIPVVGLDAFARLDGFTDAADMAAFWLAEDGPRSFSGKWILWQEVWPLPWPTPAPKRA